MAGAPLYRRSLVGFLVAAAADLLGTATGYSPVEWLTKPLLAPLLALALLCSAPTGRTRIMVRGLACATAGDVILMLPGTVAFIAGMLCFLAMQLHYVAAFRSVGARPTKRAATLAALVWLVANAVLAPNLGALAIPVLVYSAALITMSTFASASGRLAAVGGVLFALSDGLIGIGAAGGGFTGRPVLVMATYAAAQFLLVLGFLSREASSESAPWSTTAGRSARARPPRRLPSEPLRTTPSPRT